MKRILSIITLIALMFVVSPSVAFASEKTEVYNGVSPTIPEGQISIQGTSKPTQTWNTSTKGDYTFSGTSNYQTLYTSYKFTGNENYTVTVKNYSDYDVKVKVIKTLSLATKTVKANSEASFSVEDLNSSDKIYISFEGSYMDFSGTISGWEW
ncbi:hypothetical protein [Konateibacter massiliensis]|uniref:hypothetical protein n=1 Tax=Konateibacter massiliensis TaxID=2002841 RepID=UPI000C147F02|nr:hypothetical protein [Konateibacter massiliensis]